MNLKSLIEKMDQINESTKETPTGKIHSADTGGYGRKDDEGAPKEAPRGRGRPRKDTTPDGEGGPKFSDSAKEFFGVPKKDFDTKKLPGKASVKHRMKTENIEETASATDYNPPSQGGTRKELLAKYAETKSAKDATAARKAGATQAELDKAHKTVKEDSKEIPTGRIHTAEPGGYGRKDDEDTKGKKVTKDEPKRGRGRPPSTGAHTKDPEQIKKDKEKEEAGKRLQSFMVGNIPKKGLPGKPGKKHKLKDWIEHVETSMLVESIADILGQDIKNDNLDIYDAIYAAMGRDDELGQKLQDMANDISIEHGYHPDDDIEKIISRIADQLEDEYGSKLSEVALDASQVALPAVSAPGSQSTQPTASATSGTTPPAGTTAKPGMGAAIIDFKSPTDPLKAALQAAVKNKQVSVLGEEDDLEERHMTGAEKSKEERLKSKFDDSEMKASMIKQYGPDRGKQIYFATIRKKAMSEAQQEERSSLTESSLATLLANYPHEHKVAQEGWGMDESLYEALCEFYFREGRIPRKVWHGPLNELRSHVEECYATDTTQVTDEGLLGGAGGALLGGAALGPVGALGGGLLGHALTNETDMEEDSVAADIGGAIGSVAGARGGPIGSIAGKMAGSYLGDKMFGEEDDNMLDELESEITQMGEDYMSETKLNEKYMGFNKTVAAIKKGGSAEDPEAVAAAIGRKKYGKEKFQKAAAAGRKLGEQTVAEGGQYVGRITAPQVGKPVIVDATSYGLGPQEEGVIDKISRSGREIFVKLKDTGESYIFGLEDIKMQGLAEGQAPEIDEDATHTYAIKILRSLAEWCSENKFYWRQNDDGSATIYKNPKARWAEDEYRQYGKQQGIDSSYLNNSGILTAKNFNAAIGPFYKMFRQKGWRFDQPVGGEFTIAVTKEQGLAEGQAPEIDEDATTQYAQKILESLDQHCGADRFEYKWNRDGSITFNKKGMWAEVAYRKLGYDADHRDLQLSGTLTSKNLNIAITPFYKMFRQKGWRFDQPVDGKFTIAVTKEQGLAEGSESYYFDDWMKKHGKPITKDTYRVVEHFIDNDKGIAIPFFDIRYNEETVFGPYSSFSSANKKLRQLKLAGHKVEESLGEQGVAEGKKDVQMESWEAQLSTLLNEGLTVTTSTGQPGGSDSVSVTATDTDAQTLMQILQKAGITSGSKMGAPHSSAMDHAQDNEITVVEPASADEVMGSLQPTGDDSGDQELGFLQRMLGARGASCGTSENQEDGETESDSDYEITDEGDTGWRKQHTKDPSGKAPHLADVGRREAEASSKSGELTGRQKKLDVAEPKGELTGADFAKLRGEDEKKEKEKEEVEESETMEAEKTCNECGMYESECGGTHGEEKLDELSPQTLQSYAGKARGEANWARGAGSHPMVRSDWPRLNKLADKRFAGADKADAKLGLKPGKFTPPEYFGEEDQQLDELSPDLLKRYKDKNIDAGRSAMIKGDEKTLAKRTAGLKQVGNREHEQWQKQVAKDQQLDEWANSPNDSDEQFLADINYMTKVISGGLNNIKQDQTVLPSTRVKTETSTTGMSMAEMLNKFKNL